MNAAARPAPGPTGTWAIIRQMRQQGFLHYIGTMWKQHGDLFAVNILGRKLLLSFHPEHVRHVNVTNRQNYDKLGSYAGVRKYLLGDGLLASTGDLWRRQRKLMAPFYTPRGVQDYAGIMLRDGERLVERWEQLASRDSIVEISEEMTYVTASIILKTMFSMETSAEIVDIKEAVETMIAFVSNSRSPLRFPVWVPTADNRKYKQARRQVHSYINAVIAERRRLPQDQWQDDLLSRLMQARDEETGKPMSEELLRDESITTFFAGHETTARTLTFAWYALAANPQVGEALHAELDRVLGGRTPTLEDLHQLPYTLQVIKETLRLYTPAPFYIRDAIADDVMDDFHIPAGVGVMQSPYFTHRHPDFWDDPERFDPDRWTPEREAQHHPYQYHPFASGQRVCIGNNFSLLESHILLALLAQRFEPRLADGYQPVWKMAGTLGTANGMPMKIRRR